MIALKPWDRAWQDGKSAGTVASLASAGVLALASAAETGSPYACLNATSHWIWGDRAARHQRLSLRHTVAGYLIHHAASCFWGVVYERTFGGVADRLTPAERIAAGLSAAAIAAVVDFRMVPHRLSPGFELRLSKRSITAGYIAFGFGLALAATARLQRKG